MFDEVEAFTSMTKSQSIVFSKFKKGAADVNRESIPQQVFRLLRNSIANGELVPGERLRETDLAESLGVSQTSIREALQLLAHQGLVVRDQNRSSHITTLTRKEVIDRLRVRIILEKYAAAEAKRRVNPQSIKRLKDIYAMFLEAVARKDRPQISACDLEFHRAIWQMSDNEALQSALEHICAPLFAFVMIMMGPHLDQNLSQINSNPHTLIIEALEHGSVEEAEEALRRHISNTYPFLGDESDLGGPVLNHVRERLCENSKHARKGRSKIIRDP